MDQIETISWISAISGKSHNISFSVSQNRRINYNVNNPEYTQFLLKQMEMVVEKDSEVEFMYYNPYYAHLLNPVLLQHVCCLYRVIFSKSITDITPEFDLISYDNLQTASEDWYKKIISGDLLALKIGLLNQGIFISKAALNFIQNYGGIKDSVFDSIDLILNNGIINIGVQGVQTR